MGAVVAVETTSGLVIGAHGGTADDRLVPSDQLHHIVDLGTVGVGAIGEPEAVHALQQRLENEIEIQKLSHESVPSLEKVARIAGRAVQGTKVNAVVGARDRAGTPRLRTVRVDGEVVEESVVALGPNRELALEILAGLDHSADLETTAARLREVVRSCTGGDDPVEEPTETDVWTLGLEATEPTRSRLDANS